MNRERLLKKLEKLDFPELVVLSHKARLKQLLMEDVSHNAVSRGETAPAGFMSVMRNIHAWLKGPSWRVALAGMLSFFLIGSILGVAIYFASPSPAVMAADIVKKDPSIQKRLSGTGDIIIVRVEVRESLASVVCGRSMGDFIEADVDINGRSVINTRRFEGLFIPEIPVEDQDIAMKLAIADPDVKALLDRGGSIGKIFPVFSSITSINVINGNIVKVTPAATQAIVPILLNGNTWLLQVNLADQKVMRLIEPQAAFFPCFDMYYLFRQI